MKWIFLVLVIFLLTFVSADLISIGTGGDEVAIGYGNQVDLFFSGVDSNPVITKFSPESSIATDILTQIYIYNVSDNENIDNCSLIFNSVAVSTDNSINKSENNSFTYTQIVGTFNWSIQCIDSSGNTGTTENFSIRFYTDTGGGVSFPYTYYSECYNIIDGECIYEAFYDQPCPDDYFLTLEYCNEALIIGLNLTLYERFLEWSHSTFVNQTDNQTIVTESKRIINKIPRDLNKVFTYLALKITPSNELLGKCIIAIFLILIIFLEETYRLIKKTKVKDKW